MLESKNLRVLFVEDSEDDMALVLRELQRSGYEPDYERVDTIQALETALESGPWDVILADFSMPKFSGTEALVRVRALGLDVPFLFVSGTIGEETAVKAMQSGAQDYIMKSNLKRVVPAVEREIAASRRRQERRDSEDMLRKLSRAVDQAGESVFITDRFGTLEYVNPAFERLTGYSAAEARGRTPVILKSGAHAQAFYEHMWRTILAGEVYRDVLVNRRKDGTLFYEEKIVTPLKDELGCITHFVSTGRDITARRQAEQGRMRLAAILEATTDLVAMFDPDRRIRYLNASGRTLLDLAPDQDLSELLWERLFAEREAQRLLAEVLPAVYRDGSWSGETVLRGAAEAEIPASQVIIAHRDAGGQVEFLSTIVRDITERKRFEAELRHRATHDALTGLANRLLLNDRIENAILSAKRRSRSLAVIFLDLDNFKRINETLGHDAGDALLQYLGQHLLRKVQPSDTVARHGGDEFVLVMTDVRGIEEVLTLLREVQDEFRRPAVIAAHEVFVTFSMGVAMYPHDGRDAATLMRNADTAMYQAKMAGRNQYRFYAPEMNARGHELLALDAELRRAMERDQFVLHYQPQADLKTGRVDSAEALIRWQHPQRGLVSPADFMPLLEESGAIVAVGEWVLRRACADAKTTGLAVSVNVSVRQLDDPEFGGKVRAVLQQTGLAPEKLKLEITENVLMRDPDAAGRILAELNGYGVRLAIDDFGTGYSSLAYLKRFPLHVVKIDQTFIHDLTSDSSDAAIVEASITVGHRLGLYSVAEGVETQAQLDFLRKHACDAIQGYYLSRPLSLLELRRFLRSNGGRFRG